VGHGGRFQEKEPKWGKGNRNPHQGNRYSNYETGFGTSGFLQNQNIKGKKGGNKTEEVKKNHNSLLKAGPAEEQDY